MFALGKYFRVTSLPNRPHYNIIYFIGAFDNGFAENEKINKFIYNIGFEKFSIVETLL